MCDNPEKFEKFKSLVKVPVYFLHVIRNPYDTIATYCNYLLKNKFSLKIIKYHGYKNEQEKNSIILKAVIRYIDDLCHQVQSVSKEEKVLKIYHENYVLQTHSVLSEICSFLEVGTTEDYLSDCSAIVNDKPKKTRFDIDLWGKNSITLVEEMINKYDFLQEYQFNAK